MSNFKYYRRNLKLHEVEFEILLVVFEIRVKIKKIPSISEKESFFLYIFDLYYSVVIRLKDLSIAYKPVDKIQLITPTNI
ncbi:hypothetical protein COI54_02905 [Bacillus wiedmannii]|nr:hypothetical protein CN557_25950 [Bacillus wiedmannii]PHA35822.1 hypothetical protein COF06_21195 [Bacillus wiedmannii]PHG53194.1 hypothetical protein COI54_02905 [Bacillus wiedmannii]PHG78433.1 hypothetical protein COI50_10125 [Bacillus wiedmannii]